MSAFEYISIDKMLSIINKSVAEVVQPLPVYKQPGVPVTAGEPGYNEYGVPLSRCCGNEHDEHYWARVRHLNQNKE